MSANRNSTHLDRAECSFGSGDRIARCVGDSAPPCGGVLLGGTWFGGAFRATRPPRDGERRSLLGVDEEDLHGARSEVDGEEGCARHRSNARTIEISAGPRP